MLGTIFRAPAFYALGLILVVEAAVHFNTRQLFSSDHVRNPWFRRGWPDYLAFSAQEQSNDLRVLILSNSQGYGREVLEHEIYAAILGAELQKHFGPKKIRVVNWSMPPCRGPELAILLAQAKRLQPDLTLCILGPGAFAERYYHLQPENRQLRRWFARTRIGRTLRRNASWKRIIQGKPRPTPFTMFLSDLCDKAWWWRNDLPASFRHYFTPTTVLRSWFPRLWPSFRFRERPAASLAKNFPSLRRFFHEREFQTWLAPVYKPSDFIAAAEGAEWLLREPYSPLLEIVNEAARSLPGRKVFLNQPLQAPGIKPVPSGFPEQLRRGGWDYEDLRTSVPRDFFLPRGTHFTSEGHRQFASILKDITLRFLETPGEGVNNPAAL